MTPLPTTLTADRPDDRLGLVHVETDRFGPLTIDPSTIIDMPGGMPGFVDFRAFVLLPAVDGDEHLFWMQSTTDGATAFLALVPWAHFPDYEPEISAEDEASLSIEATEDLLVLTVLTISREPAAVTANLLAPVVINQATRQARQIILTQDLPTNAPLPGPLDGG